MVLFDYNKTTRIITIPTSYGTELDVQDLLDDIRDYEDEFHAMDIPHIAEASGKQDLGGGVLVGITLTLIDWKVKFEARLGPDYVLCSISGGNLVTYVSSTGTYVTPIEPSAFVTVTLTASSSATLQELDAIQYGSFDGGVWIDQVNGTAGTDYDLGTPANPVDNIANAKTIADTRGFSVLYAVGDLTVTSSDDITNYTIIGQSQDKSEIYLEPNCTVDGCEFESATISGSLGGSVVNFFDCRLEDIIRGLVNGYMRNCILAGTIHISGTQVVDILSCYSGVPGNNTPFIDFNGTAASLGMRDYAGGMTISGMTNPNSNVSMDFLSGHGKIDSSCKSGTIVVRGTAKCTDNSGDGCTVDVTQLRVPESDFQGVIHYDVTDGEAGTAFPIGTPAHPVSGLVDALSIMDTYHIETIYLHGTISTAGTEDLSNYTIKSDSPYTGRINITPGTTTVNTKFELITVSGMMQGPVAIKDAYILGLRNYMGATKDSFLGGDITLSGSTEAVLHNIYGNVPAGTPHYIGGNSTPLNLKEYRGSLLLKDFTGSGVTHYVHYDIGGVKIDSTCTSGTISLKGNVRITQDNSGPNCTVDTKDVTPERITDLVWDEIISGAHMVADTAGYLLSAATAGGGGGTAQAAGAGM